MGGAQHLWGENKGTALAQTIIYRYRKIVDHLNRENAPLAVLRASGGYELLVAPTLLAATELPVAVVNSRQVRDFARATG